jgi:hypothetical protein
MLLVVLSSVQLFGSVQFGKIPKDVGGGKPDTAYIKFSPLHGDLANSFKLASSVGNANADGFVGPLEILLRTDREIIFFNNAEASAADYLTNEMIINTPTNYTSSTATNLIPEVITNGSHRLITNFAPVVSVTTVTNVASVTRYILTNSTKMSARQIRADVVDAIIFSK